jgi:hypothetical protein
MGAKLNKAEANVGWDEPNINRRMARTASACYPVTWPSRGLTALGIDRPLLVRNHILPSVPSVLCVLS